MDTLNSDSYGGVRGLNAAGEEDAAELEINKIIQNGLAEISTEVQRRACFSAHGVSFILTFNATTGDFGQKVSTGTPQQHSAKIHPTQHHMPQIAKHPPPKLKYQTTNRDLFFIYITGL